MNKMVTKRVREDEELLFESHNTPIRRIFFSKYLSFKSTVK